MTATYLATSTQIKITSILKKEEEIPYTFLRNLRLTIKSIN